ncbi:MAG: NAD/NADP octopine/nopaline dehydrogenase family protein [bacterium]|nr:NAD/NADP octopine/nopaline dehydrogenase family protein [bacterium]
MIGVISLGNQGFALCSYFLSKGYGIIPYTSNVENLKIKKIISTGKIEGEYEFCPTINLEDVLSSDIVFITSITTAYTDIANKIVEYSNKFDFSKKIFVLFSGKLGGVLVFNKVFTDNGIVTNIVETDAIFASRKVSMDTVWVRGIKRWNLLISNKDYLESDKSLDIYGIVRSIFDDIQLDIADNFIQRGLTDFGAMAHATISLINMANIDSKRDLLFYIDGITHNTVKLIEDIYYEFNSVAKVFGTNIIHPIELLDRYYGTVKTSLLDAIKNVSNYKYTKMPNSIYNRFLYEDVLNTLYPLSLLAKLKNVDLVLVPSVVNIICSVLGIEKEKYGRTLDKMNFFYREKVFI